MKPARVERFRPCIAGALLVGAAGAFAQSETSASSETRETQQQAVRLGLGARFQWDAAEYEDDGGTDMGGGSRVRRARLTVDVDDLDHGGRHARVRVLRVDAAGEATERKRAGTRSIHRPWNG